MRRTQVGVYLVAAVTACAAFALSGCGDAEKLQDGGSIGAFASYQWSGNAVSSVHATWRVPEILQRSPCGLAATWIGASGEGKAFIQLGTQEGCLRPASGSLPLEAEYVAFWSDTSKQYHPHSLFRVGAGDLIEATLDISHRRWRLTLEDGTTGNKASFTTADETHRLPYIAEWVQEDPQLSDSYAAYPSLSQVKLSDVLVNGKPPGEEHLTPGTLSAGNESYSPTPLREDSFEVRPEHE